MFGLVHVEAGGSVCFRGARVKKKCIFHMKFKKGRKFSEEKV